MVARRVANIGAGVALDPKGLTAQGLREAVDNVMNDSSIREVCQEIGDSFRTAGGYRRAVDEVLSYRSSLGVAAD